MQTNITKKVEKFCLALDKVSSFPRAIIKYGTQAALALLCTGCLIILINYYKTDYNPYMVFVGTAVIENSFIILAEVIIGGLLIDFFLKKN